MARTAYKRELEAARARIESSGSVLTSTPRGAVEYLEFGDGPPVLWIHGVVGGCDQGPGMVHAYLGPGFRTVAVSRFGYLRSPLLPDSTPEAQADVYAALLDTLGIDKVVVVGASAGTSSSFQFVLRHASRCVGLVLWSMAVPPYPPVARPILGAMKAFFGSDFLWWVTSRYTPTIRRLMGIPRELESKISSSDEAFVQEVMASFLPVSWRTAGIINDICVSNPALNDPSPLETVRVPTLIVHARDDTWGPFSGAQAVARRIPNARFVDIEKGGHLLLGHREHVRAEIADFVRRC
jgi:pimeloyl-ACP methyl ester carboxylesterase